MRRLILLVLFVVLIPSVVALGLTPGRSTVDFTPGLEREVVFQIVNSDGQNLNLVVSAQGELAEFIEIPQRNVNVLASEERKTVSYRVALPTELEPGTHTAEILVSQPPNSGDGETYVGATLAVATLLQVRVPYPGKFVDVALYAYSKEDGSVEFVVPVVSRGSFDVTRLRAEIDVYTPLNEKVVSLRSKEIAVSSGERKEVVVSWDAEVPPGPYRAVATVFYDDEQTREAEVNFNAGGAQLILTGLEVNDFALGEIAKFEAGVENLGGEQISDAVLEVEVFSADGNVLSKFQSSTQGVEAFGKSELVMFWDTAGVRPNIYDSKLVLRYGDNSEEKRFRMDISERNIEFVGLGFVISKSGRSSGFNFDSSVMLVLIVAVVVLILINVSWFLFLRKRLRKR